MKFAKLEVLPGCRPGGSLGASGSGALRPYITPWASSANTGGRSPRENSDGTRGLERKTPVPAAPNSSSQSSFLPLFRVNFGLLGWGLGGPRARLLRSRGAVLVLHAADCTHAAPFLRRQAPRSAALAALQPATDTGGFLFKFPFLVDSPRRTSQFSQPFLRQQRARLSSLTAELTPSCAPHIHTPCVPERRRVGRNHRRGNKGPLPKSYRRLFFGSRDLHHDAPLRHPRCRRAPAWPAAVDRLRAGPGGAHSPGACPRPGKR